MSKIKVEDFIFSPAATDETIERAKKWLKSLQKKERLSGTTNYAKIKSGETTLERMNAACHISMGSPFGQDRGFVVATELCGWKRNIKNTTNPVTKELATPFATWFVKESVFSRFILNKDDPIEDLLETGIIISSECPSPLMQAICILSRHFKECSTTSFKMFNKWTGLGLSPETAYVLCFNSGLSDTDFETENFVVRKRISANHRVWPLFSLKDLLLFSKKIILLGDSQTFGQYQTINLTQSLFKSGDPFKDLCEVEEVRAPLARLRGDKENVGYTPPNPFLKKSPTTKNFFDMTVKEIEEVVLPYLIKEGY